MGGVMRRISVLFSLVFISGMFYIPGRYKLEKLFGSIGDEPDACMDSKLGELRRVCH
jgi:hypothetical protein